MSQQEKLEAWLASQSFAWPTPLQIWQASRAAALEEASAMCVAIANGFVSDVNPARSTKRAEGAMECARHIAKQGETE